jgi:hypothetical protein
MTTDDNHEQSPGGSRPSWGWRAVRFVLPVVGIAAAARLLVQFADTSWWCIACPYEVQYAEGGVLLDAVNIARGGVLYGDYQHYPFTVATYTPLYSLIWAAAIKLLGVSFVVGRALSWLATVGAAALIWAILRRTGYGVVASVIAAAVFLLAPTVRSCAVVARVDTWAVALSLAALYCIVRGGRWLAAAVVLMVLASYTKQTALAAPAAAIVYLAWMRQRRSAALVGAAWAVAVLAVFAVMQLATDGWFYRHVVIANRNRWDVHGLAFVWGSSLFWPTPLAVGGMAVLLSLRRWASSAARAAGAPQRELALLYGLYYVFSLLGALTAGKVGAGANYMLEPLAGACLMTGVAYQSIAARVGSGKGKVVWAGIWLTLVVPAVIAPYLPQAQAWGDDPAWRRRTLEEGREAAAFVQRTRGAVLSEVLGSLLVAGRPVLLEPFEMTQMFLDGHWNQQPLVRDINRQRFALIIIEWNPARVVPDKWGTYGVRRWTRGMKQAIVRNYRPVKNVGRLYFMVPRAITGDDRACVRSPVALSAARAGAP